MNQRCYNPKFHAFTDFFTSLAPYSTYIGTTHHGFTSSAAQWIWTENHSGDVIDTTIYCRKTLVPTVAADTALSKPK